MNIASFLEKLKQDPKNVSFSETIDTIEDLLLKAEKSEFETKKFSDYKDQFQWFVGFGLLFLIIDLLMLEKKTKWVQKLNLFNQTEKNEK